MMIIFVVFLNIFISQLNADISNKHIKWHSDITALPYNEETNDISYPRECAEILEAFAQCASDLSLCSIRHSRPIRLCEKCINEYMKFFNIYQELLTKVVNDTSCRSIFMSQDRLNVVKDYHDNIAAVWNKGNCNTCYDWNGLNPVLKNYTNTFNKMYNDTMICIRSNTIPDNENNVCEKCFDLYVQLDTFYKSLSADAIGVDSVCMDIVDSMNATRSIWSKKLNCCNLRRTPEIIFLCCSSIIFILTPTFYLTVRFCRPIRDLPNVLKQSRFKHRITIQAQNQDSSTESQFKQTIVREVDTINL